MRRVERVGVAEDPLDALSRRQLAVAAEELAWALATAKVEEKAIGFDELMGNSE